MLSIIVYGRNDSHGYNLHKRAALSLNAIAHVLDAPDDEIIFVDYNTPDELPTFPETIADTLTEEAKQRIRIIRVRPSYHAQFAGKTSLVALESQSRNIAFRRANPANRWILSTNTDMIFVPRDKRASLSDVCKELPDGFYHLPRFELPEGFWERTDRKDPGAMIEAMRRHGHRYHLNEIVYGGYDNLYEGPGDFQLFLREDIFRIGGFDERMILGWHVDTNTARRMRLLRGKVDTAYPALSGYHCGHTRQATSLHGARRTENSLQTFARDVTSSTWTNSDDWGAPAEVFEEFRLAEDRSAVFLSALERAVPIEGPDVLESTYNEGTYCEQGYDATHVLPHLADIVFNLKAGQSIFVVASDTDLIEGFTKFASGAPLEMKIRLCADGASPGKSHSALSDRFAYLPLERGLAESDLVLLQFPNAAATDPATRADLEWYIQHALEAFIAMERMKPYRDRRRIIIVNGTHNLLQDTVNESIDAAAMPYSSRLRHGRVADASVTLHPLVTEKSADGALCAALGRARSFAPTEQVLLRRAAEQAPGWERLALEVVKSAENADWALRAEDVDPRRLGEAAAIAKTKIKEAAAKGARPAVPTGPRADIANRLCSGADWEDGAWLALAVRYFGERIYGLQERSRWVWEHISLVKELLRRLPTKQRPWVLVVCDHADALPALLGHQGYRVAYATSGHLLGGAEVEWRQEFRISGLVLPASLLPLSKVPPEIKFEALIAPSAALFAHGDTRLDAILEQVRPRMASHAHLGASALVHLNKAQEGGALSHHDFANAFSPKGLLGRRGLQGDAPIDSTIPLDALVKYAFKDDPQGGVPGLSFGFDANAIVTVGQLWARFPQSEAAASHAPVVMRSVEAPPRAVAAVSAPTFGPDVDVVFAAAMTERAIINPSLFEHIRRNLAPFILTDSEGSAENGFKASGGAVRIAVPVAGFTQGFVLELGLAEPLAPKSLTAVVLCEDGAVLTGAVSSTEQGLQVAFSHSASATKGLIVIFLAAPAVQISSLTGWLTGGTAAAVTAARKDDLAILEPVVVATPVSARVEPEVEESPEDPLPLEFESSAEEADDCAAVSDPLRDELAGRGLTGLRIGYLNPWREKAENQAYKSLAIAAKRLDQELVYVTTSDEVEAEKLDFVIAVASTQAKLTSVPTFGCIHEPRTRFFSNPDYFTNLLSYDGYLTISPSVRTFLVNVAGGFGLNREIGEYYNTPQANGLRAPIRTLAETGKIRLCYFGTNWDARGRPLFRALSAEKFTRIYGPKDSWKYLERGYVGAAPFDGVTVQKIYAQYGAGLVVLSKDHLFDDVISNRIFEITSVGAVAICPDIPWIRENYGDSVYYYQPHGSVQSILGEIKAAMAEMRAKPAEAESKARAAKTIFESRYCAEQMLRNAAIYFDDWRNGAGKPKPVETEPLIDVIVRVGGRSVETVRRAVNSIDNQRAGRFRILFVRYKNIDLSSLRNAAWKRIVAIEQIDAMGGGRAQTMVAGLKAVGAPYFAFLDDDDYWLDNHIGSLLDQARKAPEGRAYAYSGYVAVGSSNEGDERRRIANCTQPHGTIFDILGRLQTGAMLASSALLQYVDLEDWSLHSAEDSLLHGSLIAYGEPVFTWRPTACWTADSVDASNYVERDSRQEDVFECLTRLGPHVSAIERKFAVESLPTWDRLGAAMQAVFQGKTRRILADVPVLVLEEGVVSTSIHDREDIEKRALTLDAMHLTAGSSRSGERLHILPPAQAWAFGATRAFEAGDLYPGEQWIVLEFDKAHGSFGVGVLHRDGDFVTRMEVPASEKPMELWLHVRRPEEAAAVVVQNWAQASTEPAILRTIWVARIAPGFKKTA